MNNNGICPGCGYPLGNCTGESSLYNPRESIILCEPCWLAEDALIDVHGTNNMPDVLDYYRKNISYGFKRPVKCG